MSFFLATVPVGTQLYHGTSKQDLVKGMEWLAFEPEHALIFARPRRGPPPGDGNRPSKDGGGPKNIDTLRSWEDEHHSLDRPEPDHSTGHKLPPPLRFHGSKQDSDVGYLHTYVPKHPLRLLYIDGLSAGKTSNGTLDTQDKLLLNLTDTNGPMGGEFDRAHGLCNLTSTLWKGQIDGILRMEGGFEIILCDFEKHLERTDVIAITEGGGHGGPSGLLGGWQYLKAVTSRYHGIGGERVSVCYDDFVSVFAYPTVEELFKNDVESDYAMPRLQNVKYAELVRIKDDITDMILKKDWDEEKETRNWQSVTDLVVQRYSSPLHYIHTNDLVRKDRNALATYLITFLRPFIDLTARNATLETHRCVSQFIPALATPPQLGSSLAHRTLHTVTTHICDALLTSLSIASSPAPHSSFTAVYAAHAAEIIDELVEYLQWTTWKQCRDCADEEVCFVPIWPMGSHEDHAKPQCRSEEDARGRMGYWGSRWGRGPPGEGRGDPDYGGKGVSFNEHSD
ncbi:hypothetical protein BKA66DRAFT_519117 [Pyrenochaeta sp. MPI-SDFR-AT-0127]|nr:hypothetical protein BKA66DRAFT_519117 [Pyrenochaeta sp. MPI-SDFR-AT-0127]